MTNTKRILIDRSMTLSGCDELPRSPFLRPCRPFLIKAFGAHDWYAEFSDVILSDQKDSGAGPDASAGGFDPATRGIDAGNSDAYSGLALRTAEGIQILQGHFLTAAPNAVFTHPRNDSSGENFTPVSDASKNLHFPLLFDFSGSIVW